MENTTQKVLAPVPRLFRIHSEPESIAEQMSDNKLSFHLGKTYGCKCKLHKHSTIHVQCAGNKLTCHISVKYLGAKVDQSLSGEGMVENIISKSNARLTILYRQVKKVDLQTRKLLALALRQCHFDTRLCFSVLRTKSFGFF